MTALTDRTPDFWWTGDRSEKYWIELLRTDDYGDRLVAPDNPTYATMHGVEVGDLVMRWLTERHPGAGRGRAGIYAVSRVVGRVRKSPDLWGGQKCLEIPVTRRTVLNHPIYLKDLKALQDQLESNQKKLARSVSNASLYSPWQFPSKGLKPVMGYLFKLTADDVELIVADHPHLATAMTRA